MGLFDMANISRRKGVVVSRLERIKREGSPDYHYNLGVIAAAAIDHIYLPTQFPLSRKYQPLDSMEIVNNSAANPIEVVVNGHDGYYCPAGTIRTVHGKGIALWSLDIENLGAGATVADEIRFTFKKEALTMDKWIADQ